MRLFLVDANGKIAFAGKLARATSDGIAMSHFLKWAKPLHDGKSKLECGRFVPL
jgi:hypothetical protein